MITVFFDGQCGLCAKEINHYKKVAPANTFEWVDITQTPEPFERLGYAVEEGLRLLHVQDNAGKIHIGVDAFICIWRSLKRNWQLLGFLVRIPGVKQLISRMYLLFANWRFKRMGYRCKP